MSTSNDSEVNVSTIVPWDLKVDVLHTQGFPLSSTLRGKFKGLVRNEHKCSCHGSQRHRDVLAFNQTLGADLFNGRIAELPEVQVCWNSNSLFEEPVPRYLVGIKDAKRVLFEKLPTVQSAINVLYNGTYWCHGITNPGKPGEKREDNLTKLRLYQLLAQDLTCTDIPSLGREKLSPKGVNHLKQILSTVDGLAIQICLAFPDVPSIQNWDYFDNLSRNMIKSLLVDWVGKHKANYLSFYEKLKQLRGALKELAFSEHRSVSELKVPRELSFLRLPYSLLREKSTRNMFRVSLLIQTRAVGTPPPHVFMKTFRKFRETVTTPSKPPDRAVAAKIAWATKVAYQKIILDSSVGRKPFFEVFRDSLSRAKISLSDSAELNTAQVDGGKYEAFRRLNLRIGEERVRYMDLDNGQDGPFIPQTAEFIGTRAFYYSFRKALHGEIKDLMTVRTHGVLEPGKVREITVSEIHHAVLLHPMSHVLLDVIARIPSSEAGVKAANHAFEFYKRLNHKNPRGNFVFDEGDLWIFSSDLETATDFTNPFVASLLLMVLMGPECLGMPKLYRQLVIKLLCGPRLVVDPHTNEEFMTTRGCLMGDPVTKAVLHLHHIVGKELTNILYSRN